jgi:hypothetical protein
MVVCCRVHVLAGQRSAQEVTSIRFRIPELSVKNWVLVTRLVIGGSVVDSSLVLLRVVGYLSLVDYFSCDLRLRLPVFPISPELVLGRPLAAQE